MKRLRVVGIRLLIRCRLWPLGNGVLFRAARRLPLRLGEVRCAGLQALLGLGEWRVRFLRIQCQRRRRFQFNRRMRGIG